MHSIMLRFLSAALTSLLLLTPALAEPETAAETETLAGEENPDETLIKSLIGSSYTGELEVEGWTTYGGGLVAPPIYVNLYQREDGSALVVTSRLSSSTYKVADALIISKPWKGYAISIACTQGDDFMLRYIGDARGPEDSEWWTEVRRAWEIAVPAQAEPQEDGELAEDGEPEPEAKPEAETEPAAEPGAITKAETKGVKCTNPNW